MSIAIDGTSVERINENGKKMGGRCERGLSEIKMR
jgi:hypothetical protein